MIGDVKKAETEFQAHQTKLQYKTHSQTKISDLDVIY